MRMGQLVVAALLLGAVGMGNAFSWQQTTKGQFRTGTLSGVQATLPPGEDDGLLRLATPVLNGSFDESDDSLDGWGVHAAGIGPHLVEVLPSAAGYTTVAHLRAAGGGDTAEVYQDITRGLDYLERLNFELFLRSSETHTGYHSLVFVAEVYDTLNQWINSVDYLLSGTAPWLVDIDYRDQVTPDRWNEFRLNLRLDVENRLYPYTWDGVGRIRLRWICLADHASDSCGILLDRIWAASFMDDNFNDGVVDPTRWTVYDSLCHVEETNGVARFYGYNRGSVFYGSLDRTGYLVGNASAEASARVRIFYMEPEEGQEFELGFYSPSTGKYLILKAHRLSTGGTFYVAYSDGSSWYSTEPVNLDWPNRFRTWRIRYYADIHAFAAWVDGYLVGGAVDFTLNDFYPYFAYTDTDLDPADSVEVQVDRFQYYDFSQNDWTTRYLAAGEYLSAPQDPGTYAEFLTVYRAATLPSGTACRLQFRTAPTQSDLANAPWMGPGGPGTFYETPSATLYRYHTGHRWFQLRVLLETTDSVNTPAVDTLRIQADSLLALEGTDSGAVQIPQGFSSVVHYDAAGHRTLVAHFQNPQTGSGNLTFSSAVHDTFHYAMANGISRWWNLSAQGAYDAVDLTFFYKEEDLSPETSDTAEAQMWAWRWDQTQWDSFSPTQLDTAQNFLYCAGLAALSQWTLGPQNPIQVQEQTPPPLARCRLYQHGFQTWLEVPRPGIWHLVLYDAAGRRILQTTLQTTQRHQRLLVPTPPRSGVYFAKIHGENTPAQVLRWVYLRP